MKEEAKNWIDYADLCNVEKLEMKEKNVDERL
jgi:hypothetical protein